MADPLQNFGLFMLSTKGVPEPDRIGLWREEIGPMVRIDVEALPECPFHANLSMRVLPGLNIVTGTHSPFRVGRTRTLIADGNNDLVLLIRTGDGILLRRNREISIDSTEAIVLSNGNVGGFTFLEQSRLTAVSLPRHALLPLLKDGERALQRPISMGSTELRLLRSYLSTLDDANVLDNPDLQRVVVAHVYDLVALAMGATRDASEAARDRGLAAARLRAIKSQIDDGLRRGSDLSVGAIAARQRITPRYVQMLFESEGTTLSKYVLGQRLAYAHRRLSDPHAPDRGIASVAFDAGFGDLSYFIRTFRKAYGAKPSDIRQQRCS